MRAKLGTDLSVELVANRPGMLARAAEAIASGGLNLEGFAEVDGRLHVLTSDARSARHALEAAGLQVSAERDVVVVRRRPGVYDGKVQLIVRDEKRGVLMGASDPRGDGAAVTL